MSSGQRSAKLCRSWYDTRVGRRRAIVRGLQAGLVCLNGEDQKLREHALRLAREPELRRRIGANGRRLLLTEFTVERAASQIVAATEG